MDGTLARALLGVPEHATPAEIARAFRGAAHAAHPDHGGSPASMRRLLAARATALAAAPVHPPLVHPVPAPAAYRVDAPAAVLDVTDVARPRPSAGSVADAPVAVRSFDEVLAAALAA